MVDDFVLLPVSQPLMVTVRQGFCAPMAHRMKAVPQVSWVDFQAFVQWVTIANSKLPFLPNVLQVLLPTGQETQVPMAAHPAVLGRIVRRQQLIH